VAGGGRREVLIQRAASVFEGGLKKIFTGTWNAPVMGHEWAGTVLPSGRALRNGKKNGATG